MLGGAEHGIFDQVVVAAAPQAQGWRGDGRNGRLGSVLHWGFDGRNGVDSPDGQPDRKDPQVVEDREEALATVTPQTA